jgi:hypothetical protein
MAHRLVKTVEHRRMPAGASPRGERLMAQSAEPIISELSGIAK